MTWLNNPDPHWWEYGQLVGSWSWLIMIPSAFLIWGNVPQFKKNALTVVPAIGIVSIGGSYFLTGLVDHETFTAVLLGMIVIAGTITSGNAVGFSFRRRRSLSCG